MLRQLPRSTRSYILFPYTTLFLSASFFISLRNDMTPRQTAIICILLPGILTICFWLYSPGLHGPFVFDDWVNLPALNGFGDGIHRGLTFRSDEHTSELQSLMRISYAVFCLKKKNNYQQ